MNKTLEDGARVGMGQPKVKVENPGKTGPSELEKMEARLKWVMRTYELDEETFAEIDAAIEAEKRSLSDLADP